MGYARRTARAVIPYVGNHFSVFLVVIAKKVIFWEQLSLSISNTFQVINWLHSLNFEHLWNMLKS